MEITDQWFDGDMPNPLHPIGALIDPRTRTVQVERLGVRVTLGVGDIVDDHGIVVHRARTGPEPKTMEVWRD